MRSPPPARTAWRPCSRSPARTSSRCTTGGQGRRRRCAHAVDVRHEQTAVFAAEAHRQADPDPGARRPDRRPRRHQRRQRRSPRRSSTARRWSSSAAARRTTAGAPAALQELDQPPLLAPVTKLAAHRARRRRDRRRQVDEAFTARAGSPHRGPVFLDVPMDEFFSRRRRAGSGARSRRRRLERRPRRARPRSPTLLADAAGRCWCSAPTSGPTAPRRPALRLVEATGHPRHHQRHGPRRAPRRATRCSSPRRAARRSASADLRGRRRHAAGLPARLRRLRRQGRRPPARSCTSPTPPRPGLAPTPSSPAAAAGDLTAVPRRPPGRLGVAAAPPDWYADWVSPSRRRRRAPPRIATGDLLASEADPIHPARIYGELVPRLADGRGRHRRRRRLRVLRRASSSSRAAGRLARPGALRLPGHRPRLRDRRPAGPAVGAGRAAARRRRRRASR